VNHHLPRNSKSFSYIIICGYLIALLARGVKCDFSTYMHDFDLLPALKGEVFSCKISKIARQVREGTISWRHPIHGEVLRLVQTFARFETTRLGINVSLRISLLNLCRHFISTRRSLLNCLEASGHTTVTFTLSFLAASACLSSLVTSSRFLFLANAMKRAL